MRRKKFWKLGKKKVFFCPFYALIDENDSRKKMFK
jgi:hypothetical protein